jgi:uncharacterized protein (DUF1330 family)
MGMFDTVIVEGLKLKAPKEVTSFLKANNAELPTEFQTKDLDNVLGAYKLNAKGDIFREERKPTGKKIPYELPFLSWKDNRAWLERVYWKFKHKEYANKKDTKLVDETKSVFVKVKLTNTFTMLAVEMIGGRSLVLDYEVKVIDGKVKATKLIEWSIESEKDAQKRRQDDEKFVLQTDRAMAKHREFKSKWYYPIIKETYNPFIFFSRLTVQAICNYIIRCSYRWTGV